jgi:hypothetical protein
MGFVRDETEVLSISIDLPVEGETIRHFHYAVRITAPLDAELVEISIDAGPWRLCRYRGGYWWYDWADYFSGTHSVVARVRPFDQKAFAYAARRLRVSLD